MDSVSYTHLDVYKRQDLDNVEYWTAEFYDGETIRFYRVDYGALKDTGETKENLYELCPLQGVPNNLEMLGDAEKVLGEIDDYDRVFSDERDVYKRQILYSRGNGSHRENHPGFYPVFGRHRAGQTLL